MKWISTLFIAVFAVTVLFVQHREYQREIKRVVLSLDERSVRTVTVFLSAENNRITSKVLHDAIMPYSSCQKAQMLFTDVPEYREPKSTIITLCIEDEFDLSMARRYK